MKLFGLIKPNKGKIIIFAAEVISLPAGTTSSTAAILGVHP